MKSMRHILLTVTLVLPGLALADGIPAKLYKNPSCGCCEAYAKYLEKHGFEVEVVPTHDLPLVKQEHKVPGHLEGCHTTLIDDYVLEGHIPVESIERLLSERPMIRGLSVPGMPPGSPGMGGPKRGPLEVYYLMEGDEPKVYATH